MKKLLALLLLVLAGCGGGPADEPDPERAPGDAGPVIRVSAFFTGTGMRGKTGRVVSHMALVSGAYDKSGRVGEDAYDRFSPPVVKVITERDLRALIGFFEDKGFRSMPEARGTTVDALRRADTVHALTVVADGERHTVTMESCPQALLPAFVELEQSVAYLFESTVSPRTTTEVEGNWKDWMRKGK